MTEVQPWSRPPFEKGNLKSVRHGAFSERIVDPVARQLVERALASSEYLNAPEYEATLMAWARAEAKVTLLDQHLERIGVVDDEGRPRPLLDYLHKFEGLAARHRDALGLSPLARARLGRDVAAQRVDLARLMADIDGDEQPEDTA